MMVEMELTKKTKKLNKSKKNQINFLKINK